LIDYPYSVTLPLAIPVVCFQSSQSFQHSPKINAGKEKAIPVSSHEILLNEVHKALYALLWLILGDQRM
jgi:hypothetical protein